MSSTGRPSVHDRLDQARRLALAAAAAAAVVVLAGCAPDHGTVTDVSSSGGQKPTYTVCVDDGRGHHGCDVVTFMTFMSCHKGSRWSGGTCN